MCEWGHHGPVRAGAVSSLVVAAASDWCGMVDGLTLGLAFFSLARQVVGDEIRRPQAFPPGMPLPYWA